MFNAKDLYPNWGGIDTREMSIPERTEQGSLSQAENIAPEAVNPKTAGNLWIGVIIMLAAIVFFNLGGVKA